MMNGAGATNGSVRKLNGTDDNTDSGNIKRISTRKWAIECGNDPQLLFEKVRKFFFNF